jgi:uncharacterized membrane protein YbaN (DUF454 family)
MRQRLYKPLGFLFLALAGVGVVLPVMPSTPFLLLAAWFFARSSEKWHRWLLANEVFGPTLRRWEDHRCISLRTKIFALCSMLVAGGASITFALDDLWPRLAAAAFMSLGAAMVLGIKTCNNLSTETP